MLSSAVCCLVIAVVSVSVLLVMCWLFNMWCALCVLRCVLFVVCCWLLLVVVACRLLAGVCY